MYLHVIFAHTENSSLLKEEPRYLKMPLILESVILMVFKVYVW